MNCSHCGKQVEKGYTIYAEEFTHFHKTFTGIMLCTECAKALVKEIKEGC